MKITLILVIFLWYIVSLFYPKGLSLEPIWKLNFVREIWIYFSNKYQVSFFTWKHDWVLTLSSDQRVKIFSGGKYHSKSYFLNQALNRNFKISNKYSAANYFLPMLPMTVLIILLVGLTKKINLQHLFVKNQIVWNFQGK